MGWDEARRRAQELMKGVQRGRVAASEPGVELAYLDWGGNGELIVFHHANGFSAASFAPIAAQLRDSFRVVAFDARGHGDSTPVEPGPSSEGYKWSTLSADYAAAVSNWLDQSGIDKVRLGVGHSFGGALTLGAAHAMPARFESTLLLDPVIFSPDLLKKGAATPPGNPLAAAARRRRARFSDRATTYAHFEGRGLFASFPPESLALYVEEGFRETESGEVELKCSPAVEAAVFEGGGTLDLEPLASEIDAETHFIHAELGNFSRAVYDGLAKQMPRATVETLSVGHLMAMEAPQLVVERILERVGHA